MTRVRKMREKLQDARTPAYKIVQFDFLMKGLSLLGTPSTSGSGSATQ